MVEIGPAVLEKKMNIWKVYDNANENGDNNDNNDNDNGHKTNFEIYCKSDPVIICVLFLPLMFSSSVQILLQTYEFVLIGILFPDIAISKKKNTIIIIIIIIIDDRYK